MFYSSRSKSGAEPGWWEKATGRWGTKGDEGGGALGDEGGAERGNWFFRHRPEK